MPVDTWGSALWDQVPFLKDYTSEGILHLEKANDFFRRRAEIEKEYAQALKKLVKHCQSDDPFFQPDGITPKVTDKKDRYSSCEENADTIIVYLVL
jgi:hypothetical protein